MAPIVVWLASYPRSGVSFLRHVIQQMYGLPTYTLYPGEARTAGITAKDNKWPRDADPDLPVHFVKVHEAEWASRGEPAIHLLRDGRDTLVSYAYYIHDIMGDNMPVSHLLGKLVDGDLAHPHWGLHTMAWFSRKVPRLRFDELVIDPAACVQRALDGLALPIKPLASGNIADFSQLHANRPQFFRAGTSGQWQKEMTQEQLHSFWETHGAAQVRFCEEFGLDVERGRTAVRGRRAPDSVRGLADRKSQKRT